MPPAPSGVPAHLFREPCEEVPTTQEVQNKVELALGLEGWGEGKRQWWSQLGTALSSLSLSCGRWATYWEGNNP